MKTDTKSSHIRNKGMKSDGEKSDSGQNKKSSKPGTSRVTSPVGKEGKGQKHELILHIGGNDDIAPYACGTCKSRFFYPIPFWFIFNKCIVENIF